ncbi:MAG: hypothetical protein JWM38_2218 [Sphingomonas bacterium]|nr:hypothetical protein [Sphingomonas bacterium]
MLFLPLFLSIGIGSIERVGLATLRPACHERTYGWGPQQIGPLPRRLVANLDAKECRPGPRLATLRLRP